MSVRITRMKDTREGVFIYDFSHDDWFPEGYVWNRMHEVLDRSKDYLLKGSINRPIISRESLSAEIFVEPIVKGKTRVRVIQKYDYRDAGMTRMIKKCLLALEDDGRLVQKNLPGFD